MIFLDDITTYEPLLSKAFEDTRTLRIHPDVMALAYHLAADAEKLEGAAPYIFMPAYRTWIEWEDASGKMGFYFDGEEQSVIQGIGLWGSMKFSDSEPLLVASRFDVPGYQLLFAPEMAPRSAGFDLSQRITVQASLTTLKPIVWAVLALINSPKIIRHREVNQRRINMRRQAAGRYTFHPHHEVRLDVDKRIVETVRGVGEGASKALHFVRTHLRFRFGQYELVSPHWRGDPALGIRDTNYRVDRQKSRWRDRREVAK